MTSPNPYQPPRAPGQHGRKSQTIDNGRKYSWATVVVLALVIPGLPIWLNQRDWKSTLAFLGLLSFIPISFAFFGPFWDMVLFDETEYYGFGFYPFLAVCLIVPVVSLGISIETNRRAKK